MKSLGWKVKSFHSLPQNEQQSSPEYSLFLWAPFRAIEQSLGYYGVVQTIGHILHLVSFVEYDLSAEKQDLFS